MILDRGSDLFTEDKVRSMTCGEVGMQTAAIVSEVEYPSGRDGSTAFIRFSTGPNPSRGLDERVIITISLLMSSIIFFHERVQIRSRHE